MKKIIFTLLMALFVIGSLFAQETGSYRAEKTVEARFENTGNQFVLNSVGQVIVKESSSKEIRCVVKIVTYGSTQAQANVRQNSIKITSDKGGNGQVPQLTVQTKNGLYLTRHYNIVTVVYLPSGVEMRHTDNLNFMDLFNKLIKKIIP